MVERLLNRLENQRGTALILWVVVVTAVASLVVNLLNGSEIGNWLETWLSDLSSDLLAAGLVVLLLKAYFARRDQHAQTPSKETQLVTEAEATKPAVFTYYIEAEQTPPPTVTSVDLPTHSVENLSEEWRAALDELIAALKKEATPEARQVHLDKVREQPLLVNAVLISLNLQRAELQGVNLSGAQLTKANLRDAQLQGANLQGALLKETQLIEADMQGANLSRAILEHTFLSGANLNGANLSGAKIQTSLWGVSLCDANLQEADLTEAELFKTNLSGANLRGATFADAKFSTDMILPDGTHWNDQTDFARFTDPTHVDFWRSGDPHSPAYAGKITSTTPTQ